MKHIPILLIGGCIFCSCAMLHPSQIKKDAWNCKDHHCELTLRPDTCRKHHLVYVYYRLKKPKTIDTTALK